MAGLIIRMIIFPRLPRHPSLETEGQRLPYCLCLIRTASLFSLSMSISLLLGHLPLHNERAFSKAISIAYTHGHLFSIS